jgi:hypothetical protein
MGWLSLAAGVIILLVVLSIVATFGTFLFVTHQTCAAASTTSNGSGSPLFGIASNSSTSSNSTTGAVPPLSPVPVVTDDLVLAPLATLSLTTPQGNGSAVSDLTDPAYWKEVSSSELQTYEQLVPQTVLGFFNSSQEWKAWALQHIPVPPGWLAYGLVPDAEEQVQALEPASGGTGNSTVIAQRIQNFAASAAGVTLASLDFLSFNGLSALQVLFETNNATLAVCQTMPGQLAQLYTSSFDPTVPQAERAQYLGKALAITSVMLIVGGKDGFADEFGSAIDGLGLGDSWPAVKPYLGDIAAKVSDSASSATFGILQTLAQRFPQDSAFVTGFTADRMDSMVDVLGKKGVSDGQIQGDIQQIAAAAGSSTDEQATGEAADLDSLQQGGGIQLSLKTGNKLALYQDASGKTATLRGTFLQQVIPGFDPRGPDFVQVHYEEAGVTVYQYYEEKVAPGEPYEPADTDWNPRAPGVVGSSGDIVTVSFELLTPNQFLESVPPIPYLNTVGAQFVADFSEVKSFVPSGGQVTMNVEQEPFQGVSGFSVDGTLSSLSNSNGDTFIDFTIQNLVHKPKTLKITFDGYGDPALSIQSGNNFSPVTGISSDGVRLKFVSNSGGSAVTVTTLYLKDPSILYAPGDLLPTNGYSISGASQIYQIDQVTLSRGLEQSILQSQDTYDIGIVGSEIAYTVGERSLGLQGIDMPPVSQGGVDLYTTDGSAIMQARMLAHPLALGDDLQTALTGQLSQMVDKLGTDFDYHPGATTGYAVLSYVDPTTGVVKTLVAVVPKQ